MAAPVVADARFFAPARNHTLASILSTANAALGPPADTSAQYHGVAPLQTARADQVSFLDNRRYAGLLAHTRAGAVILHPGMADRLPAGCIALITDAPYLAWARVCTLFHPPPPPIPGVHPRAVIDPTAQLDPTAEIGPLAVIGPHAQIGPASRIEPHAVIGAGVVIGADCTIGAGATITHAVLGDRVRVFPGARIGQDGFGFAPDGAGGYVSVPQLGRVIVEHDVEIGANTTIDRGSMQDTVIGAGSRLDNLVQIGHNVQCGRGCVIVSQAGISGSTILEDHVMVAGQAGLIGHLRIGQGARIAAQAGVMSDVPAGAAVMGSPGQPLRQHLRQTTALRRLAERELRPAARAARNPGGSPRDT